MLRDALQKADCLPVRDVESLNKMLQEGQEILTEYCICHGLTKGVYMIKPFATRKSSILTKTCHFGWIVASKDLTLKRLSSIVPKRNQEKMNLQMKRKSKTKQFPESV